MQNYVPYGNRACQYIGSRRGDNPSSNVNVNIGYVRSVMFVQELHYSSDINTSIAKQFSRLRGTV